MATWYRQVRAHRYCQARAHHVRERRIRAVAREHIGQRAVTGTASPEVARRRATRGRIAYGVCCVLGAGLMCAVLANLASGGAGSGAASVAAEAAVAARFAGLQVLAGAWGAALVAINVRALRPPDASARPSNQRAAIVTLAFAVAVVLALVAVALVGGGASDSYLAAMALLAAVIPACVLLLAGTTAFAIRTRSP